MASGVPIVRQFAWLSVVAQLAMMGIFIGAATLAGLQPPFLIGVLTYLAIAHGLRRVLLRDQRTGIALFRLKKFGEALPHFERSYAFFTDKRWADNWRFVILASSSRISYREMALLNMAFCYSQMGQGQKSEEFYRKVAEEFPGSQIAEMSLKLFEAAKDVAGSGVQSEDGDPSPSDRSGTAGRPPALH